MAKIRQMSRKRWDSLQTVPFRNVARDFSAKVKFFKYTPSGNMKIFDPVGISSEKVEYVTRIARNRNGEFWFTEGGSPLNSYVYRPKK